ncbi:Membrane-associated kinase regulator [Quillaja saponaria]|uniref:Membrane-associated kinase regulator n=1 Tax=Quillaja saponaria TaxID=32244 RepID=A0AAD7KQ13_QUISA|nr:Membrane-associated kinase regulator [Quillaja saponaria]
MAVDVCSEISSTGISPRISFSHDLKNTDDAVPMDENHRRADFCLLDSSSDFVFSISNGSFSQQLTSADELFSNGKIVPMEIKQVFNPTKEAHQPEKPAPSCSESSNTPQCTVKKRLKEFLSTDFDAEEYDSEKPTTKSFWQFNRSSSLNCEASHNKGLIRSLQFLSRSNSTGSAPNPKQTELPKETQKQRLQRQPSVSSRRSSSASSSCSSTYYFYNSSQSPSLKKNFRSCSNGVRINPVLNLPPQFIPKSTVSFFGFGSLFCNGKFKKKKKK